MYTYPIHAYMKRTCITDAFNIAWIHSWNNLVSENSVRETWSVTYVRRNIIINLSQSQWVKSDQGILNGIHEIKWTSRLLCRWEIMKAFIDQQYSAWYVKFQWASYQKHKIMGCACAGNARNVSMPLTSKKTTSQRSRLASRHVIRVGIADPRWQGKRSRHSRRMRKLQF